MLGGGRMLRARRERPAGITPGHCAGAGNAYARRVRGVRFHMRAAAEGRDKPCLLTNMENEALFRTCR